MSFFASIFGFGSKPTKVSNSSTRRKYPNSNSNSNYNSNNEIFSPGPPKFQIASPAPLGFSAANPYSGSLFSPGPSRPPASRSSVANAPVRESILSPGPPVPRSYPKKIYYTHTDTSEIRRLLPNRNNIVNMPQLPHANIQLVRSFEAVPGLFYTIRPGINSGFGFTLAQVEDMELKRLASINRARGGKRRRSRHPKKSHKRTTRRRL